MARTTNTSSCRIYLLVGEPDKALDLFEPLLKMPYYLSPGWLRIDPAFASLKGNPRFERLVAGKYNRMSIMPCPVSPSTAEQSPEPS